MAGLNPQFASFGQYGAEAADAQTIERNRLLAQAMLQRAQQAPEGRMVGRAYVAPSWTQYAAQALQGWKGNRDLKAADEAERALAERVQNNRMTMIKALMGGQGPQTAPGDPAAQGGAPAAGMDPNRAMALIGSGDPMLAGLGQKYLEAQWDPRAQLDANKFAYTQKHDAEVAQRAQEKAALDEKFRMLDQQYKAAMLQQGAAGLGLRSAEMYYNTGMMPPGMAAPPNMPPPQGVPQMPPAGAPAMPSPSPMPGGAPAGGQPMPPGANPGVIAPQGAPALPPGLSPKAQQEAVLAAYQQQQQAAAKRAAAQPKAEQALRLADESLGRLMNNATELQNHPSLGAIVGSVDARTPTLFQGSANAEALLDTLKSQVSLQAIADARAASTTGGAFGTMTQQEWPRLENSYAALQQSQDLPTFKKHLGEFVDSLARIKSIMRQGYQSTYGGLPQGLPDTRVPTGTQAPAGAAPGGAPDLGAMFEEAKKRGLIK